MVSPLPCVVDPADDDSWTAARLFPVVGVGEQDEQGHRATAALLAGRLGAPAGLLETYLEVQSPRGEGVVIPDGVLRVERGGRRWTALLEAKAGTSLLDKKQVESYLDVARERGYDAVVTLSSELPAAPGERPVFADQLLWSGSQGRRLDLAELGWFLVGPRQRLSRKPVRLRHGPATVTGEQTLHDHDTRGCRKVEGERRSGSQETRDAVTHHRGRRTPRRRPR